MKTVGIIGGIGPESTVQYYRSIITSYREQKRDGSYPSLLINSIDLTRMLGLIGENRLLEVTEYLVHEVQKLAQAGAGFGILAANTPHIVFNEIQQQSSIPLISIVEVTCKEAQSLGMKRVGIFGTRATMPQSFYPDHFSKAGIGVVAPKPNEQRYIHDKYMNELVNGIYLPETHQHLLMIVDQILEREGVDGLILGGTELPLILKEGAYNRIPFLDTTQIHVKYVVEELLRK
jgi:aspartate racemase